MGGLDAHGRERGAMEPTEREHGRAGRVGSGGTSGGTSGGSGGGTSGGSGGGSSGRTKSTHIQAIPLPKSLSPCVRRPTAHGTANVPLPSHVHCATPPARGSGLLCVAQGGHQLASDRPQLHLHHRRAQKLPGAEP